MKINSISFPQRKPKKNFLNGLLYLISELKLSLPRNGHLSCRLITARMSFNYLLCVHFAIMVRGRKFSSFFVWFQFHIRYNKSSEDLNHFFGILDNSNNETLWSILGSNDKDFVSEEVLSAISCICVSLYKLFFAVYVFLSLPKLFYDIIIEEKKT